MRALLLLGTPVAAGLAGAVLTVSSVSSPVTGPLTLLFVLLAPAVCVALLLPGLDPLARWIVAGTASVALAGAVAEIMLVTSTWSPRGGIIAVAATCFALAVPALFLHRRGVPEEEGGEPEPDSRSAVTAPFPIINEDKGDG
jgi:hypothetical protein